MRIVVHDYTGHPFQVQLSRELVGRGHEVVHVYSGDFQTPKGDLEPREGLSVEALSLGEAFQKDSFVRRRDQEVRFGRVVGSRIAALKPDLVISSNAPVEVQRGVLKASRAAGSAFVFWVQDLAGEAIYRILGAKLGIAGRLVGRWYQNLEYALLRDSDAVVLISEDFAPLLRRRGVAAERMTTIENWAPLDAFARSSPPARTPGAPVEFVYSGTLGYKHNPEFLLALAREPGLQLRVYSEGRVAERLREDAKRLGLSGLEVLPWAPFDRLPGTLGGADVLLAMIEADAGVFSVPSKVLTSLAAGRPLLASIPPENLAARIVLREKAGLVSAPGDVVAFVDNARRLKADPAMRRDMGERGRAYAERAFGIVALGDRFEAVFAQARATRAAR